MRGLGAFVRATGRDADPFVVEAGRFSATATIRILGAAAFVFCLASLLAAAEPKIGIAYESNAIERQRAILAKEKSE